MEGLINKIGVKQIQSGSYQNTIKYKYYNDRIQLMCAPITIQPVDIEKSILIIKNAYLSYKDYNGYPYHGIDIFAHNMYSYASGSNTRYILQNVYVLNQLNPILTSNSINIYNDSVSVSPPKEFYALTMSVLCPPQTYYDNYIPYYDSDDRCMTRAALYDNKVYSNQNWQSCNSSILYNFDWEIIEFY